jgi:two-component system, chemotaxis family, sensor kinase CheA
MDDFELILKNEFLDEAAQSLSDTEQCFLMLENDPNNVDNLNKIFRLAHNLKGSSKAVGFLDMSAFTHEFESFILKLKNGELAFSPEIISLMLTCNDHLIRMVADLKQDHGAKLDSTELLDRMQYLKSNPQEEAPAEESYQEEPQAVEEPPVAVVQPVAQAAAPAVEAPVELEPNLELLAELLGNFGGAVNIPAGEVPPEVAIAAPVTPQTSGASSAPTLASTAAPKAQSSNVVPIKPNPPKEESAGGGGNKAPAGGAVEESIRISVTKLESLLNFVGEMVILQSVLKEQTLTTESAIVRKTTQQIGKVVKEIQDISMSLRMVPIKPTFQKMQRIVRDTAVAVQKDVGIKLVGEDTELDKTVLEKINDPLVHLIRNSVDHGIEPADVRVAEGKPAKGLVTLSAAQKSGKLVIEVTDDGGGLNPEKLKKKAIEKGILKPGVELSEKEAFNLIFAPGFSTKEQVSDVSGRGVGMDVVKTNIHELSGEIQIFSQLKKGTTFQITLPLSLAIIDGMVISFANDKFVVPLNQVYETLRPKADQVQFNQSLGYTLMLRGENLPLYRLGDFFNYQSKQATTDMIALVIRSNTKPYAILVDDILGQYQVVVKKLSAELQNMKGISGSTILGDGKPSFIIEPNDLIKRPKSAPAIPKLQVSA